ncbi:MAG: YcxB family protein [Planctomycetaceae bacterium]|nr:MAG: YcxB family protein [Planctomycetaceae bacterium]
MKVNYELTREDLAAFVAHHQEASPAVRRQRFGALLIAFGALMILPVAILITRDGPLLETARAIWPLLLGPTLFAIFAPAYVRWRTRKITDRMLSEGQNKDFYGECELAADDLGLTETRPSGSTTRNWGSVERVVTTASHLFLYTSGIEAFVVPRRAFSTESQFQEFRDRIEELSGLASGSTPG